MGLAAGHLQAGRYTDAAEHAGAALALDPSRTQAHVIRAESLVKVKSPEARRGLRGGGQGRARQRRRARVARRSPARRGT